MARICAVCGKRPQVANLVSHANNKVKKWVYPNVHAMSYTLPSRGDSKVFADKVCTKCVKARLVQKVI